MKRLILTSAMMFLLLIAVPDAGAARPQRKGKARTGAVKRNSRSTPALTWVGDIPSPKYMSYVWERNATTNDFKVLEQALKARGYYYTDEGYCKSGVACIRFGGGRFESDVFVAIPDATLRAQYYQAAKNAFGSNNEYMIEIEDDEVWICHLFH